MFSQELIIFVYFVEQNYFNLKPQKGAIVEGKIITIGKRAIYVEIKGVGTAIILGKEYLNTKYLLNSINIGDTVEGKVLETENSLGYIEISLKEARQSMIWKEIAELKNTKKTFNLAPISANKGGLILNWKGIKGFLPASQLSEKNYPKIKDGDKNKILNELNNLIGKELKVSILSFDSLEEKIFFTEKEDAHEKQISDTPMINYNYQIGEIFDTEIINITNFAIFLKIKASGEVGMVHKSEISWTLITDPAKHYSIGDKVKAQIIDITEDGKKFLSIKQLKENPWEKIFQEYQKGTEIEGIVIKYESFGIFISVQEGVTGLLHASEIKNHNLDMKVAFKLGQKYKFKIAEINVPEQKLSFSL